MEGHNILVLVADPIEEVVVGEKVGAFEVADDIILLVIIGPVRLVTGGGC